MTIEAKRPRTARILPLDAVRLLICASETPIPRYDPDRRDREIDAVTANVKKKYPEYFRQQIDE